ncbi:mas-related G-protein coupled receptor member D-like [Dryobates pubescens]|uniref:mas-related G-protein coupled receptor member D-like n=1 Tax=Dryobates pubescens TaxID=118200 RepID=UPI0023B9594A|nr:mas-related G-protein coupled receptor member D-like [Dryobates pubescens]
MEETIPTDPTLIYTNTTYPEPEESYYFWCESPRNVIFIIFCVCTCICVCGLVGNAAVLWLLGFRMKRNPFTVYVLNLAVADCSLLLILLAKFTLYFIAWVYCIDYRVFDLANTILFFMYLFCYVAGMYLLTAMSVERCLAALFPVWYRCHRPKHLSRTLCGMLWTLAALFLLLLILTSVFTESLEEVFSVLNIVNFLLFSFFPLLSNLALFIKLRCGSQGRHPGKLYVAVLLSVLFLFFFGLPLTVSNFLLSSDKVSRAMSLLLVSLNSSINPLLYFLVGSCNQHRFQYSVKAAYQRLFEEEATSEERSQVPEDAVMETSV